MTQCLIMLNILTSYFKICQYIRNLQSKHCLRSKDSQTDISSDKLTDQLTLAKQKTSSSLMEWHNYWNWWLISLAWTTCTDNQTRIVTGGQTHKCKRKIIVYIYLAWARWQNAAYCGHSCCFNDFARAPKDKTTSKYM